MFAALVRKELLALARDVHGLAALFLMPVMFFVIMSLALKDVYSPPQRTLAYAVDARDTGALALALQQQWQQRHGAAQPLPADWPQALRSGRLKYVLVLQEGLSAELARPRLPTQPQLQLLAEPGIDANLLESLLADLVGAAGELKARHALEEDGAPPPPAGASMRALVSASRFASRGPQPSAVQHNVAAWLVFGMFFVVASLSSLLVQERGSGALARLHSLGVARHTVLLSKALPYLGVNLLQALMMLAVALWLMPRLGGETLPLAGVKLPALGLALVSVSLAAVGMGLALAGAVRTHAQASAVGPIVNVLMGAVGGIMVPTFVMPAFMQRVAACSPMNWGLEALLAVLLRGGDSADVMPHALRLGAFAALMLGLAVLLLRRPTR
jgi:ABC-2 type transport system permease protein